MSQFDLNKMQEIQKELQEKYKNIWKPNTPENSFKISYFSGSIYFQ